MSEDRIVIDGHERLTESSGFRALRSSVAAAVRARYAERLAGAGILRRIVLHLRMRREIARELARIAPPDALYFRS